MPEFPEMESPLMESLPSDNPSLIIAIGGTLPSRLTNFGNSYLPKESTNKFGLTKQCKLQEINKISVEFAFWHIITNFGNSYLPN